VIGRWRDLIQSRRQQRIGDMRERVVVDADRARLALVAAIVDARRVGAPVPVEIGRMMVDLAVWVELLRTWARESEA
jgi:hypothetical protein